MNESIEVKTKNNGLSTRVGIENNKIVIFREHLSGEYHGYIVENFKTLNPEIKNALYNAGLIQDTIKGKIK